MSIGRYIAGATMVGVVGLIILNPTAFTKTLQLFVSAITGGLHVASGKMA